MGAFALVIALADFRLFDRFVPENRALRDVEARSALLLQSYYRYMLTPSLVDTDVLDADLVLIRQSLERYRRVVAAQAQKQVLADGLASAIDTLESSGNEMILARRQFEQADSLLRQLESQLTRVFDHYRGKVSDDIAGAMRASDWEELTARYLPELRMIENVHRLYLELFLEIRQLRIGEAPFGDTDPRERVAAIGNSSTLLEIYEANAGKRAWLATQVLIMSEKMQDAVTRFRDSRKAAEFALSTAEQAGIDLNQAIGDAIGFTQAEGWTGLRESLYMASLILLLTLLVGYLLIYFGLDRMLRPLEQLQMVITRLGKGDFKQRSGDAGRGDEIGRLARAFDSMAEQLEENNLQKQEFIKQLEEKNMELERFTYTVSHELKSPLVTVSGFIGLLRKDLAAGDREKAALDMDKISAAITTMSRQLEDLLELSRVGRVINPPTRFPLTDLCHEVVQMMQGLIDERGAMVEIEDEMPEVYADQARIREVIKNLVENGIKFTPAGCSPRVEIGAEPRDDRLLCRVCDNGPGIEPRYQSRVFGLFERLDNAIPGTGVGLALVKRIVEIHDGDIWIESRGDGQGSCFCFTLPIHRGS